MKAQLYSVLGFANAKLNVVVRTSLFLYTSLLDRIKAKGGQEEGGKEGSSIGADMDEHRSYPFTLLRMYDRILRWNNFTAWDISTQDLQTFYDASVSKSHLDVGVGSGYLPAHSKQLATLCKQGEVTLHLWDRNPPPLLFASKRITGTLGSSVKVRTREVDICDKSLEVVDGVRFDTVTMFYLFHCVEYPNINKGASEEERAIEKFRIGFENVKAVMAKGATLSGTTIVSSDDPAIPLTYSPLRLAMARAVMTDMQFNLKHFFNQHDTASAIEEGAKRAGLKKKSIFFKGLVAHFVFQKL